MAPQLPARKAGGRRAVGVNPNARGTGQQLPIAFASEIELPDGTKIPIKIPPGMPPHQAQALIAYLQANPESAKQVHQQAQEMMKTPGMAHAFMNMQQRMQDPDMLEKYQVLKDDPELKVIFDDVVANGPSAFAKYWDDTELMTKVSAKLRAAKLGDAPATTTKEEEGEEVAEGDAKAPRKTGPAAGAPPADVHDAAKKGDVEALKAFLEQEGVTVNSKNERGITVLGVAVGFNREAVVDELLSRGVDVEERDPAGNTVLFYAAGYGRLNLAKKLLAAGADINATNKAGQKPTDVAKMNGEKGVVKFLQEQTAAGKEEEAKEQDA